MSVQIRRQNADQSVKSVEADFEHLGLSIEQQMHLIFLNYLPHHRERKRFIPKSQIQKPCDEVHALTVVQLLIDDCICT